MPFAPIPRFGNGQPGEPLKKLFIAAALLVVAGAPAFPQAGQFPSGTVMGNSGAGKAQGIPSTVTSILDRALGSTRGALIERGASGWGLVTVKGSFGKNWKALGQARPRAVVR
jgi:hypothetical protein